MSDTHDTDAADQHDSSPAAIDSHGDAGHGDGHGDGHGAGEALGPIGWRMWGAGVVGVVAALLVVAGFVVATSFSFGA